MPALTIQQAYELGIQHHRAGRLQDAESLYRQILTYQPNHVDALKMLAHLAFQTGRHADAAELLRRALALQPDSADLRGNLGMVLASAGRLDEAIAEFRQALAVAPQFTEARYNLANALREKGLLSEAVATYRQVTALQPDRAEAFSGLGLALSGLKLHQEAVIACQRAVDLRPDHPEAHYYLAAVLRAGGNCEGAIAAYRQAATLRADFTEAWCELGNLLREQGRLDDALASLRRALASRPGFAHAHNLLALVLLEQRRLDEAAAACRQALSFNPNFPEAYSNLGLALQGNGRLDEAISQFKQAIALRPSYAEAYNNLGIALWEQGRLKDAAAAYEQSLALEPNDLRTRFNRACLLLAQGDFDRGWPDYEARSGLTRHLTNIGPQPIWDGSDLQGRRILVHGEEGFGDTLQFIRYASLLAARGARVVLRCPQGLRRLLSGQCGVEQIIGMEDPPPAVDVQCSLLSLPRLFGATLENIPADVPYIAPDKALVGKWQERVAREASGMTVGLVWAGNPAHRNDRNRSMPLAALTPLGDLDGVRWISLQKGKAAADALAADLKILDWTQELTDFADTAALAACLDLIICVDTSVAHLAGAMGKAVWVLLPFAPDWRWLLNRSDSPWYPSMRLFRQSAPRDWTWPVAQLLEELRTRTSR